MGWPLSQLCRSIMATDERDAQDAATGEGARGGSPADDMAAVANEREQSDPDTEENPQARKRPRGREVDSGKHKVLTRRDMVVTSEQVRRDAQIGNGH